MTALTVLWLLVPVPLIVGLPRLRRRHKEINR